MSNQQLYAIVTEDGALVPDSTGYGMGVYADFDTAAALLDAAPMGSKCIPVTLTEGHGFVVEMRINDGPLPGVCFPSMDDDFYNDDDDTEASYD